MFKNYLLLTFRTLYRQKITSFIAIMGLALAIAGFILLFQYIDYQRSFDNFIPKEDQIKRLVSKRVDPDLWEYYSGWNSVIHHTADNILDLVPSIEEISKFDYIGELSVVIENEIFHEDVVAVDNNFFEMIPFTTIKGDKESFLDDPYSIVLDSQIADKYFKGENPIGKEIILREYSDYILTVKGVVNIPKNSHLYKDESMVFIPYDLHKIMFKPIVDKYETWSTTVYFKAVDNYNHDSLIKELNRLKDVIIDIDDYKSDKYIDFFYEDFKDIHLFSKENIYNSMSANVIIIIISSLTLILLVVSIINTVSILIAQSITRTREVGVRCVMGSQKKDLIIQFLTESIILSFLSLILGLIIAELLLPTYRNIIRSPIEINYSFSLLLIIFSVTLLSGVISGLYPALYLSSLKVVESLKGKSLLKLGKIRKILVLIQFLFSSILLLSTLIFNNEIKFLKNIDVGFKKDNLLYIFPGNEFWMESEDLKQRFKDEVRNIEGVNSITYTGYAPWLGGSYKVDEFNPEGSEITHLGNYFPIDSDYIDTIEVEVIDGDVNLDKGLIITETAKKHMNLNVGDIYAPWDMKINAIIKDYLIEYPRANNRGLIHILSNKEIYMVMIRVTPDIDIKQIKKLWQDVFPNRGFDYGYISDEVKKGLSNENTDALIKLLNSTTALTLLFTFLGLFGIILHNIKSKTKEIGIRKVMGAEKVDIILGYLKDNISHISIAVILGVPVAIYISRLILDFLDYPYPAHNKLFLSLITISSILVFGVSIIVLMILKQVNSNPATSLRYE